jgi:hypothetical protein
VTAVAPPSGRTPRDVAHFVLSLDQRLERFDREILIAEWDQLTGRSRTGSEKRQLQRAALLTDPSLLPWVRRARDRDLPYPIARRLELLERILLDARVEQAPEIVRLRARIEQAIVRYRPRWKGRPANRAAVLQELRTNPRREIRRAAYYAFEPLQATWERDLVELVERRNEGARAAGFPSYPHMRLGFEGITPTRLDRLAAQALELAPAHLKEMRASFLDRTGAAGWYPWDLSYFRTLKSHLPDRWFRRRPMMTRVLRAAAAWGFPIRSLRFRLAYHDLPAGGITLAPDPPRDVRILVHPRGGFWSYYVMFHEVGHAIHSASIRAPRHLLRWHENVPGFAGLHEGIGELFERIPLSREWLVQQPGISARAADAFAAAHRDMSLLNVAALVPWIRTELELYRRPGRDPRPMVERGTRQLFGFGAYPPRSFFSDGFYVSTPIYAPNYLLAALVSAQLESTLRERFGDPLWPNRKVGPWLTLEWMSPGSLVDWVPRLREVTGHPFGAEAFRRQCARSSR